MKKLLFAFVLLVLAVLLALGLALVTVKKQMQQPLGQEQVVEVLYGDSVFKLAETLRKQLIYDSPSLFIAYTRLSQQTALKAGEYQLSSDMSIDDLLQKILKGQVIEYSVTFIEGKTLADAVKVLQKSYGIVSTIDELTPKSLLAAMGAAPSYSHPEGLIFANTYRYIKGSKDRDILRSAHQALEKALDAAWLEAQQKQLPYKNRYELLVMASIIERETSVEAERTQVAGVFVARLQKGMLLQTDPTVIYAMGEKYQGRITRNDLRIDSPYNTYRYKGLPPSPIALVSQASLKAAANPLLNDKLYFVAKGDGYHHFSATLAEHNEAVRRYQLKRSSDYRSTPKSE